MVCFFYYDSQKLYKQSLVNKFWFWCYSANVSFSQFVLMAFFSYFKCTAHKTERFLVQKATNGASCTLQAKWIQLKPACWHGGKWLRGLSPRTAEAKWTAGKQEPDGSPFHSASSVSWYMGHVGNSIPWFQCIYTSDFRISYIPRYLAFSQLFDEIRLPDWVLNVFMWIVEVCMNYMY